VDAQVHHIRAQQCAAEDAITAASHSRQRASADSCCTARWAAAVRASPSGLVALAGGRARHGPGAHSAAIAAAQCSDPRGCLPPPRPLDATLPPAGCGASAMRDRGCGGGFGLSGRGCGVARTIRRPACGEPSMQKEAQPASQKRGRSPSSRTLAQRPECECWCCIHHAAPQTRLSNGTDE
jgi:hypothetical protein